MSVARTIEEDLQMTNEELQKEMIAAMKAKDKVRLSIIRQVKAEVKNIESLCDRGRRQQHDQASD